jgi:membrane protease YdiL (CAAX protease family)
MAVQKATDALLCAVAIVVPLRLAQVDLGSIYWQKGKLKLGLLLGLSLFTVMAALGLWQADSLGISRERVLSWTPWILLFILANGFLEELLFRGIFLKKYEPFLGPHLSNLATALVFAIGHSWVHYTTEIVALLILTFIFALLAGYVMQKTQALWPSVLFHAGADTLIIIGMFAGVKT